MRQMRILAFAAAVVFLSAASMSADESDVKPADQTNAKAVEIPLKRIWSSGIPDTQLAALLDPAVMEELNQLPKGEHVPAVAQVLTHKLRDKSLVYRFLHRLDTLPRDAATMKGFAVSGTAAEALRKVVRTPIDDPPKNLPSGKVTLVFFAHHSPELVQIQKVEQSNRKIQIRYTLAPNDVFVNGNYFALISLGQLPPGKYDVDIESKQEKQPVVRRVCRSFSFNVEER